jgi:hypothetical protein
MGLDKLPAVFILLPIHSRIFGLGLRYSMGHYLFRYDKGVIILKNLLRQSLDDIWQP